MFRFFQEEKRKNSYLLLNMTIIIIIVRERCERDYWKKSQRKLRGQKTISEVEKMWKKNI